MPKQVANKRCKLCGRKTRHTREWSDSGLIVLALVTCGLALPITLIGALWQSIFTPWYCDQCGKRR